jgi:hypothetical protein
MIYVCFLFLTGALALGEAFAVRASKTSRMHGTFALRNLDLSDNCIGAGECSWLRNLARACLNIGKKHSWLLCACMHACMRACLRVLLCVCIYYVCVCVYIYIYIYMLYYIYI